MKVNKSSWFFRMASKITRLSNLGFLFYGYIKNKIWNVPRPQPPNTIRQLPATALREYRNMATAFIQIAFDGMINRPRRCQNPAGHSFPNEQEPMEH